LAGADGGRIAVRAETDEDGLIFNRREQLSSFWRCWIVVLTDDKSGTRSNAIDENGAKICTIVDHPRVDTVLQLSLSHILHHLHVTEYRVPTAFKLIHVCFNFV